MLANFLTAQLTSRLEAELEKGSTIDICRPLYTATLAAIGEGIINSAVCRLDS
jgi:hypothetical protein